jgi:predicted DNA-binding transcriptional regulator YafY
MFFKHLNRLQQIDQLIRQQRTGNAGMLAQKLGVSRRQVYYFLDELRELGLEIDYSRELGSFHYRKPYRINISIDIENVSEDEVA